MSALSLNFKHRSPDFLIQKITLAKIIHIEPIYKGTMHNHINDITNDLINRRSNKLIVHV